MTEHPDPKKGMHGLVVVVVAATHTPPTSGLLCWQTSPGAHTGGDGKMLPPHGPPAPEMHPHAVAAGRVSQVAPVGQAPPQVPVAVAPHGRTHSADGPGQQVVPAGVAQTHPCSHTPPWQESTLHGLPSSQSLSL